MSWQRSEIEQLNARIGSPSTGIVVFWLIVLIAVIVWRVAT